MLERLAAWFLNTYVAEYVGNLNTDQLSIALLQGAVELEKLPLKRDALRKLKLPIDIKTGFIGKLKIEIPVARIQSQAWVMHIEDLYLVAGPSQLSEYDQDEEDVKLQNWKEKKLKGLEEKWRDEMQKSSWWNMFSMPTTFLANIIHNIQIVINNVHIRYEDSDACPGSPFAVGITVENISAQTTNENWEPQFGSQASQQRKLFDCRNLSVYWDTNLVADTESGPELVDLLRTLVPPASSDEDIMASSVYAGRKCSSYMVNPVNGQIRLTWNRLPRPLSSPHDGPRLEMEILLDDVSISLTQLQYHSFLNLADELQLKSRATKVVRWRPKVSLLENPSAWWRFAFNVAIHKVEEQRSRKSWSYVLHRSRVNVHYVRIYVLKLTSQHLDEESQVFLTSTERDLSFDELYLLRVVAMGKVKKLLQAKQLAPSPPTAAGGGQGQSFLERWLPGWSSTYMEQKPLEQSDRGVDTATATAGIGSEPSVRPAFNKQQSIKEEDEFLQALGFEDRSQTLIRDRKFIKVGFSLKNGSLKLLPSSNVADPFQSEPILELKFNSLFTSVDVSPKLKETVFFLSLGSINVVDNQNADSLFPFILQPRGCEGSSRESSSMDTSEPLVSIDVKRETVKHRPTWSIAVHSKPLDVVLHSSVVHQLKDFFTRKDQYGLPLDWTARVRRRVRELRAQTAAELRGQIEELLEIEVKTSRARLNIDLDISAPQIIIPHSLTDCTAPVMIVDLGHIVCTNAGCGPPSSSFLSEEPGQPSFGRDTAAQTVEDDDEDEDEFMTPPSTPPSELEEEGTDGPSQLSFQESELGHILRQSSDPYDRYTLKCSDLQLLVVKAEEKTAGLLSVSHSSHHLLDRFTLSVELRRKLKFSSDPQQANKLLSAQLPVLSFHLDEDKVTGLIQCLQQWIPQEGEPPIDGHPVGSTETNSEGELYEEEETMFTSAFQTISDEDEDSLGQDQSEQPSMTKKKAFEQSKLAQQKELLAKSIHQMNRPGDTSELDLMFATSVFFDMQFTIGEVMLTVNSRGREALKLSIADVKVGAVRRPYDFKGRFIIGDLAIVDCIQNFGPHYEWLMYSSGHYLLSSSPRNSSSIIIRNEPTTSTSLQSAGESARTPETFRNPIFLEEKAGSSSHHMLVMDFCQLEVHSPDHPEFGQTEGEVMRKVDINCEGIDVIANTGTIAEIISFVKRVTPQSPVKKSAPGFGNIRKAFDKTRQTMQGTSLGSRVQGYFYFGRLHVCIIRGIPSPMLPAVAKDTPDLCYVVGTIAANRLQVQATVEHGVSITAKLSGVEVSDCTLTGKKYSVICKVGNPSGCGDRPDSASPDGPPTAPPGSSSTPQRSSFDPASSGADDAVVVEFTRAVDAEQSQPPSCLVGVRVASIHYTHTLNFAREIHNLVSDFQLSMAVITDSLRGAAVGVAKGIVRQVTLNQVDDVSLAPPALDQMTNSESFEESAQFTFLQYRIDIATPVVMVPKSSSSDECLIFHLGKISVANKIYDAELDKELGKSPLTFPMHDQSGKYPSQKLNSPANEPIFDNQSEDGGEVPGEFSADPCNVMGRSPFCPNSQQLYEEITVDVSDVGTRAVSGFDLLDYAPTRELLCTSDRQRCFKIVNKLSVSLSVKRGLNGLKLRGTQSRDEFVEGWGETGSDVLNDSTVPLQPAEYQFVVTGKVDDQVSLKMSKDVFEQIKTTVRHLSSIAPSARPATTAQDNSEDSQVERDSLETSSVDTTANDPVPSFFASFLVSKLSLELTHDQIAKPQSKGGKISKFVFVVMKDFSVQASKHVSFETNFDLRLGSLVIEDLLQPEDSNFRYIFLTSTKLLPSASLMPNSMRKAALQRVSGLISSPQFATPLFSKPTASSSPKQRSSCEFPLRAFSRNKTVIDEEDRTSAMSEQSLLSQLDSMDLFISISGLLVSQSSPDFAEKYESASIHVEADFSSASVTINLQTWVLLLDFLGIGTPTPPPSPAASAATSPMHFTFSKQSTPSTSSPHSHTSPTLASTLTSQPKTKDSSSFIQSLMDGDAELFYSGRPSSQGATKKTPSSSIPGTGISDFTSPLFETVESQSADTDVWGDDSKPKMRILVRFQSLDVTFNKAQYPLAKGTVSGLNVSVKMDKGNIDAEGGLALISVMDLTAQGHYYKERFATTGEQALKFKIFKYGKQDPQMERPFDFSVEVELGSLRYIHTMRFLKEALAFCMHFPQLIDAFQRMKELARGTLVYEGPKRKPRIVFKVDAEEAYLLIPKHAEHPYLIVGDIGRLTVRNQCKYDGQEGTYSHRHNLKSDPGLKSEAKPGTAAESPVDSAPGFAPPLGSFTKQSAHSISPKVESQGTTPSVGGTPGAFPSQGSWTDQGPCLLDCIEVKLMDVDVFTARRVPLKLANGEKSFRIIREAGSILKEKSALDLFVERNLHENFCRSVPDLLVDGVLQKTRVLLDKKQLELVKGMLDKNLGESVEQFETPNTVIKDPVGQIFPSERWTTFLFNINLVNVQLELLQARIFHGEEQSFISLARADIEDSSFTFEGFSDQCKKVDFVNRSAVGYDARYEDFESSEMKPNAFVEVLRPRRTDKALQMKSIQVEIHVFMSPSKIEASIVIHKVRIMGILDLILELKSFIFDSLSEEMERDDLYRAHHDQLCDDDIEEVDGVQGSLFKSPAACRAGSLATDTEEGSRNFVLPLHMDSAQEEDKPPRLINVKVNVTETDLVMVEDLSKLDSSAIVLKGTLLFKFTMTPDKKKDIHVIIENMELFSCSLVNEEGTALSILEPINAELEIRHPQHSKKIHFRSMSASQAEESVLAKPETDYYMQLRLPDIKLKFSYFDLKMFVGIVQSLSRMKTSFGQKETDQFTGAQVAESLLSSSTSSVLVKPSAAVEGIEGIGGAVGGAGDLDTASVDTGEPPPFKIGLILVDLISLDVCIIDDCHYQNVPVIKLSLSKVQVQNKLKAELTGALVAMLSGEYFNRTISQWEPLMEEWGFKVTWKKQNNFQTDIDSNVGRDKFGIDISSKQQLLLNLTSSLLQLIKTTHHNWTQDLYGSEDEGSNPSSTASLSLSRSGMNKMGRGLALLHSVGHLTQQSKRETFVPYLLKNNTGLPLSFAMMTSLPSMAVKIGTNTSPDDTAAYLTTSGNVKGHSLLVTSLDETSEWREVPNGGELPFDFQQSRTAARQRRTNDLTVHQLLVQVKGWKRITFPVSVDKVGVVFREIYPEEPFYSDDLLEVTQPTHPLRLVFAVSLSSAQKVINVRSSLVLHNSTDIPFEVKVKFGSKRVSVPDVDLGTKGSTSFELSPIAPDGYAAVPINMLDGQLYVRPKGWGVHFCSNPLEWKAASRPGQTLGDTVKCEVIGGGSPFLFCSCTVREGFPLDVSPSPSPAHTLTLAPPIVVMNLLPCDLHFRTSSTEKSRLIRKGEHLSLYHFSPNKMLELMVALDDYPLSSTCKVSLATVGLLQKLTVYDVQERPLVLTVECIGRGKQAIEVLISCPFWLMNDTALPLIVRQDRSAQVFANQYDDHERATSRQPLLFSFADVAHGDLCSIRLGKATHSQGKPKWCHSFSMIEGPSFQRLFWDCADNRPDREYQIGMHIHHCRGKMRHTRVVTFVPHYKLENRTSHELSFLQRFQTFKNSALEEKGRILTAKPGAVVTFHWPRFDQDQLLCVRIKDLTGCKWSGGFPLVNNGSLCLNLRDGFGHSVFLRVETVNKDATSFIIFSEALNTPLPFRLENFSQVPVVCHQAGVHMEPCQYHLNPGQSVYYAWDEPNGEKSFSLRIVGVKEEDEEKVIKPVQFGTLGYLYYENHIYIGAPATFATEPRFHSAADAPGLTNRLTIPLSEMVLDVPQGKAVVFRRKSPQELGQLWRMTAEGQLVHIASSAEASQETVLDIGGGLPSRPGQFVPLVLHRKTLHSRSTTQKWSFREGLLVLKHSPHLCVQTKRDYQSFRGGSDVILGFVSKEPSLLQFQEISAMKHTPGSGALEVNLIADGPTRVLKIKDANKQYTHLAPRQVWVNSQSLGSPPLPSPTTAAPAQSTATTSSLSFREEQTDNVLDIELSLSLSRGAGVSIINSFPEELMFATLSGVSADLCLSPFSQKISLEVEHLQVDNQLVSTSVPIVVYPAPNEDEEEAKPAPQPAVSASLEHIKYHLPGTTLLKHCKVNVCNLNVLVEERLLFRLIQWIQEGLAGTDNIMDDSGATETFSMLTRRNATQVAGGGGQLHIESIDLHMGIVRLSLQTTSNLPPDLRAIKYSLGMRTVTFEAPIQFDRYSQHHLSGTTQVVLESIGNHYMKVVKGQSIKIAGSVDILGNPTGLVTDIASGVSGMFSQHPDILGLFRDVSHGIFDSTSKITGSASYFFGQASFDTNYQDEREQMSSTCQTSSDHLSAGLIGLSSGIFGGLTSMVTQPYYGMVNQGIGGFFTGLGKGVVGTITKPVAGLLDLASNTSAALRETTSRVSKVRPDRLRPKRCCVDPSGALVPYQPHMAKGQIYLRLLQDQEQNEMLIAYEHISVDGTRVLVSSDFVYVFSLTPPNPSDIDAKINLELLHHCRDTTSKGEKGDRAPIIVLSVEASQDLPQTKTFKFRCKSESIARNVSRLINFAKTVHEYRKTVVQTFRLQVHEIW